MLVRSWLGMCRDRCKEVIAQATRRGGACTSCTTPPGAHEASCRLWAASPAARTPSTSRWVSCLFSADEIWRLSRHYADT